jgi:hypothetical protein
LASEPAERRLVAILSADVAGYSRLMAADEEGTVRRLGAYREQVAMLVRQQRGRLVDFTGDNFLAEFPSALDAAQAGVEIQRVLGARNAQLPAAQRLEFRIGIHLGDVRIEEGRLYGDTRRPITDSAWRSSSSRGHARRSPLRARHRAGAELRAAADRARHRAGADRLPARGAAHRPGRPPTSGRATPSAAPSKT